MMKIELNITEKYMARLLGVIFLYRSLTIATLVLCYFIVGKSTPERPLFLTTLKSNEEGFLLYLCEKISNVRHETNSGIIVYDRPQIGSADFLNRPDLH